MSEDKSSEADGRDVQDVPSAGVIAGGKPRTCVLYLCHVVTDETIFRFRRLETACAAMGYDLYWGLDTGARSGDAALPDGVNLFTYSFASFAKELPSCVFHIQKPAPAFHWLNGVVSGVMPFYTHHVGEYDRLWVVEYDVCTLDWCSFFRRYEAEGADLVAYSVRAYEDEPGWAWFHEGMDLEFRQWLFRNTPLHASFNPLSRVSFRLLRDILAFCNAAPAGSRFYEWVWVTVAMKSGYDVVAFESNNFSPGAISPHFDDYRPGIPYHPVKLDINWAMVERAMASSCAPAAQAAAAGVGGCSPAPACPLLAQAAAMLQQGGVE